ncbi:cytochrome P450 [Aspergillus floccosus]
MLCSQTERKVYHMQLYFLGQGPEEAIQVSPTGRPPVERCPEKQVKIPAPKLAAATRLYDFCYSVMHKIYGPIVQITSDEFHINDATFYNASYTGGANKREKYHTYVKGIALPQSVVSTLDHNHHAVTGIEPLIQGQIKRLVHRLELCRKTGSLANLNLLFHSMTIDVISHYAFNVNYGFLDIESLQKEVRNPLVAQTLMVHLNRFLTAKNRIRTQAIQTRRDQKTPEETQRFKINEETIFTTLLSNSLPASERTHDHLQDEGMFLLQAGSESTGQGRGVTMSYILRNKAILASMQEELSLLMPDPSTHPTMAELQALPYFSAVINEGFRLSFGTLILLPRIALDKALHTTVSQSTYLIHTDPKLFPDTHSLASTDIYLTVAYLVRWVDMELANDDLAVSHPYRDRLVTIPKPGDYRVEVSVKNVQGV